MKFTKKEACEKLTALLTNGGKKPLRMSAKTLESHVETLMTLLDNDELELDDFVNKVKPMLESTNSNVEHDVSRGIKDYQDKNPYKKPEKKEDDEEEIPDGMVMPELSAPMALPDIDGKTLDEVLCGAGKSFQQRLFELIDESGMDDVSVYKKANIDRKVFSRIRCKADYKPKKKTAVAFTICLAIEHDNNARSAVTV